MTTFGTTDVVVIGAGPVGLWLAAELRVAGAAVTVLEERTERDPHSKALTVHPRTIEVLDSRGAADVLLREGMRVPSGHFAVLDSRLDFAALDTPYPFTLALLQGRTEELLEEHARDLGADVRRGVRVTDLEVGEDAVVVRTADGGSRAAARVVGCDGVRSTVRAAAGIGFPGTEQTCVGWLADVRLAERPDPPVFSSWGAGGQLLGVPLPDGHHRLVGIAPDDVRRDRPDELTLDEVRAKTTAVAGRDWGAHSPAWLSRFGNAARQAERYRAGRVLLAGDAAHQHMPAGGVGMNVGIQDAMNLGWKLGAVVGGTAPEELLDTYHAERWPVGRDLLRSTQAQTALMTDFSPDGRELRALLTELIREDPGLATGLAERLSGLRVRYPAPPDAHPLVGARVPDLALTGGDRVLAALRSGGFRLLDLTGEVRDGRGHPVRRVESTGGRPEWTGVEAVLVRPDGHVAWAGAASEVPAATGP
ncbi:FAD-dependent monooxygenase [Pseudonocardia humida]|uniref:FAD-dependent monooxygenase n=1 Tax=Pseudonocardia humida TaxID=2800819 RepID=A0ABT1AC20_9PSEU|nr:FAD-dependent monooxygenase [Pseudonocardia humida]MCO1660602.1 FAD-dependent monooxygenase [Pseudonocardia humida]